MASVCIAVFGIFFFSFLCFHIAPYRYRSLSWTRYKETNSILKVNFELWLRNINERTTVTVVTCCSGTTYK